MSDVQYSSGAFGLNAPSLWYRLIVDELHRQLVAGFGYSQLKTPGTPLASEMSFPGVQATNNQLK